MKLEVQIKFEIDTADFPDVWQNCDGGLAIVDGGLAIVKDMLLGRIPLPIDGVITVRQPDGVGVGESLSTVSTLQRCPR